MNVYRVSLIGHARVEHHREIEACLEELLPSLLRTHDFVEFQLGRQGEFDVLAASCIKRIQNRYGKHNSSMALVLPYPVADLDYYKDYYDDIFIPEEVQMSHPKGAIVKRNRWLVEHTELLIAYVRRETGGAAACLRMAQAEGIEIIKI